MKSIRYLLLILLSCFCLTTFAAEKIAPESLAGKKMFATYYDADGSAAPFYVVTFVTSFGNARNFTSQTIRGQNRHVGNYRYRTANGSSAILSVEHKSGRYRGLQYSMNLLFFVPNFGFFTTTQRFRGKVGRGSGVFMLYENKTK